MHALSPDPVTPDVSRKVMTDTKGLKKSKPMPPVDLTQEELKGKAPDGPALVPDKPSPWNHSARLSAEDRLAPSSSEPPCCPSLEQEIALKLVPSSIQIGGSESKVVEPTDEAVTGPFTARPTRTTDLGAIGLYKPSNQTQGRADQPGTLSSAPTTTSGREGKKKQTGLGRLFRKSKTSSDEDSTADDKATASSMAKLNAEATNDALDIQRLEGIIPEVGIGEGLVSLEERGKTIKPHLGVLEVGESESFTMPKAASNFGEIKPIMELLPTRNHSMSEDAVLTLKDVPERLHSLSADNLISSNRTTASHALGHDKTVKIMPSTQRAHRLSADATVPVRTAAPGHDLDADPRMNVPQQLFSHELLDDMVVERQTRSPRPHSLGSDKKSTLAQKERQSHVLHLDKQISLAQRQPQLHGLHTDKVLPGKAFIRSGHDIAHNVRILSPSGQVRDPHSTGTDEIVKEAAVFRKSPHPEAIPGHHSGSSSSGDANGIPVASLNANLQNAGQALEASFGRENDTARVSSTEQGF